MFKKYLVAVVIFLLNINSLAAEFKDPKIPKDIYIISNSEHEDVLFSQNQSDFSVITRTGTELSLEDFLYHSIPADIAKVKNVEILLEEHAQISLKLLLKLLSNQSKNSIDDLEGKFSKTLDNDKIIDSLPLPTNLEEKLANLILELVIWTRTESFIAEMASDSMKDLVFKSPQSKTLKVLVERTWELLDDNVWILAEASYHNRIANLMNSYIGKDLLSFLLATNYQKRAKIDVTEIAIQSTFIICQYMNFAIRHSKEFKEMKNNLAELIYTNINKDQIHEILGKFDTIRATTGNCFTDTQLRIINRILQTPI